MNINATLLGEAISFALVRWITVKWIWSPLMGANEERKKKIADGLAAAEKADHDLKTAQDKADEIIHEARQQESQILEKANRRSNEIVEEAKSTARKEAERLLETAKRQIESETSQAKQELRAQVVDLAMAGASKILDREVKADDHNKLLDDLASQL